MKRKSLLIVIIATLSFLNSDLCLGQTALTLETKQDEYCTYIVPSITNSMKLIMSSMDDFNAIMSKYNYVLSGNQTEGSIAYYASKTARSHFRIITKGDRILLMNFNPNNIDLIKNFRSEVRRISPDLTVEYDDGYEVYRLLIPYEGLKYKVSFRLKDDIETFRTPQGTTFTNNIGSLMVIIH